MMTIVERDSGEPADARQDCTHLSPGEFRAILFDLDGTLVDTAPDLLLAINLVIGEEGGTPLSQEEIHPFISHGSRPMIERGFGIGPEAPGFAGLMERFLAAYRANIVVHSRLFPGMGTALARIEARSMVWGIVTNKSRWLTEPLLAGLGLAHRAACVVTRNTTEHPKPHPAPLLFACDRIGVPPAQCLYIGDAATDIEAGRRAGARTAVALFGYIPPDERPSDWGADCRLPSPRALADWLANNP
ncbi:MAG: phosphoglycolate phosphatase [Candidatus Kentron sp. G]|nr:MAG: phosphoglycolate phosphatase [Candidatus Kentron sp. G]VFN06614.1 MAG: phosphoglycolate phosphatase [Candidatus Kentron sp. G]